MTKLPSRFKLDRELGRGGMGVVYKAFDTAYGRDVAVKVLPEHGLEDCQLHRFRREGAELAEMSHPNVVACYEFGHLDQMDYIVMEYVDGGCLRDFVQRCQSLADIVKAYCAICEGLEHIHSQGIVHRDVKPANILVTADGVPKISDFGIARRIAVDSELTQGGTILGTSSYVAPEQIISSRTVTPSVDLYALGVCLFESLTGRLPFSGDSEYAMLQAHMRDTPATPSSLRSDIPPRLDEITLKLLGKSPSQRPSGARQAVELFKTCLELDFPSSQPGNQASPLPVETSCHSQRLEGLLTLDSRGMIESCNPQAALLLGRTSQELFGQPIERFLPDMRQVTGRIGTINSEVLRMDAHRLVEAVAPMEVTVTTTESSRGRQLTAVLRAAPESDDVRMDTYLGGSESLDFLSRLCHEIWTPMNGVLGMTRLTLGTDLGPEQREYLEAVHTSAELLSDVLNTAFDLSRLKAGTLSLEPVLVDIRQLLESVLKPYQLLAQGKGLELGLYIEPLVPDTVLVDPGRLRQLLRQLLSNALKFTEKGGLNVVVSRQSGDVHVADLRFSVSDTGIGLTPGQEEAVFRPFYQEDDSISRSTGGVGLGLAIVKGIARLMGGRVWVDSQRGRGSVFHFECKLGVAESLQKSAQRSRLDRLKVLLIDPGQEYGSLQATLKRWGLDVVGVSSEGGAGRAIEQARSEKPFDLVLAEVHGRYFDAFAFVREYKLNREAFVLFTSELRPGDAGHCRKLGVEALLRKPIQPTELWDSVLKILENGPRSCTADFGSLRILVAEDNPINQTLAKVILTSRGHQVTIAQNGLEVFDLLENESYDLILMDLQMPLLDGLATTQRIRAEEKERRIPIVAVTAHGGNPERCFAVGMDAFLTKPLDEDTLMDVIARVVDHPEVGEATPSSGSAESPQARSPAETPTEESTYDVFDERALLARLGGNGRHLVMMIDLFMDLHPKQVEDVRAAITNGDAARLHRSAHTLKGSLANFSAQAASDKAGELSALGQSGRTADGPEILKDLESELGKLLPALLHVRLRHDTDHASLG